MNTVDVAAVQRVREALRIVRDRASGAIGIDGDGDLVGWLPPIFPGWLGDRGFAEAHGVRFDPVATLVDAARAKHRAAGAASDVRFDALDVARQAVPGAGTFDVLVSMNTLYWHPDPDGLLRACRAALRQGGCAVIVTYTRRAWVVRTVRDVAARDGVPAGLAALRWLVPTAAFELLRDFEPRYPSRPALRAMIEVAGFEVLEERDAFLAGLCRLVWARATEPPPRLFDST